MLRIDNLSLDGGSKHGLCVVEIGHSWLVTAVVEAVRVGLENQRAREAAMQLGLDDA